eukprot:5564305-Prymnesium_polylepis.1
MRSRLTEARDQMITEARDQMTSTAQLMLRSTRDGRLSISHGRLSISPRPRAKSGFQGKTPGRHNELPE